jgi:hypothetical protein
MRFVPRSTGSLCLAVTTMAAIAACAISGAAPSPLLLLPDAVHVRPAPSGGWRAASFVRAPEGCVQTWTCDCTPVHVRAGCHAEPSGDAATSGACAADSGPVNGCDRCMALEPADACACSVACP